MMMNFLKVSSLLITVPIASLTINLPVALGAEQDSQGAAQLTSAPELMQCSFERSRALWQFPNPARLGDVPCQSLNSIGGPGENEDLIYHSSRLASTEESIDVDIKREAYHPITQPLDAFAPVLIYRGEWLEVKPVEQK